MLLIVYPNQDLETDLEFEYFIVGKPKTKPEPVLPQKQPDIKVALPDCQNSLVKRFKPTYDNIFVYSENQRQFPIGNGWQTFFENKDSINCPFIECKLLNSKCEDKSYKNYYVSINK